MKSSLALPQVYQAFQEAGGFFGARAKAIAQYLPLRPGARIIDIGCGPGHITRHVPDEVDYIGFDTDQDYIDFATRMFGAPHRTFHCGLFDNERADRVMPADAVMMNGVLHHMGDADARDTIEAIARVLAPGGVLFTLDGAYRPGQSPFVKWLLDNDRGAFVRPSQAYVDLLKPVFSDIALHVREDLSRVPYTYAICVATKRPAQASTTTTQL